MPAGSTTTDATTFAELEGLLPGGAASAARRLARPVVVTEATGAELTSEGGQRYIDLNCGYGAILLGRREPWHEARTAELAQGMDLIGLGTTRLELDLAERLIDLIPSAELVAYCTSGTEATLHAVRLARAVTGRRRIVKFQGTYHGWHDYVAMNWASTAERLGSADPFTAGALPEAMAATVVLPFNDLAAVEALLDQDDHDVAAVLVEPLMHNVGCIPFKTGYAEGLRALCNRTGVLLVFDEIITGFRHALGGYQSIIGVTPDIATFGKAIGNGHPLSAVVGRRDLMERFAGGRPDSVALGGTFNAHPRSVAAALATIERLEMADAYPALYAKGEALAAALERAARAAGIAAVVTRFGSVVALHFQREAPERYEDLVGGDLALDAAFRRGLLDHGIATAAQPLRRFHVTLAHTEAHITRIEEAAHAVLRDLAPTQQAARAAMAAHP
jgi:glutamate-1-semialdehyde 2,1-aminomutase